MPLVIAGLGLLCAILFALLLSRLRPWHHRWISFERPPDRESRWMQVVSMDCGGAVLDKEWVRVKEPDRFLTNGLSHLGEYVTRLIESPTSFPSLAAFAPDANRGLGLHRCDGVMSVVLVFRRKDGTRETRARALLAELSVAPSEDRLMLDGTRMLMYPLDGGAEEVTRLCTAILKEVFDIADAGPLDITFEEREMRCL